MKSITKTRAIGGSLVVTIPSQIVKMENLSEGQTVEIDIEKKKGNFFGALKGISKFTMEDRTKDRD